MSAPHTLSTSLYIDAPPEIVWKAFTEHGTEWFTPRPWTTPQVDYDLFPGGRADIHMQSPEGERHSYHGIVLYVETARLLVTTGAILQGWIPHESDMNFVRLDHFKPQGEGTFYTAEARHWTAAGMQKHSDMGFADGWGAVTHQLAEVADRLWREAPNQG